MQRFTPDEKNTCDHMKQFLFSNKTKFEFNFKHPTYIFFTFKKIFIFYFY